MGRRTNTVVRRLWRTEDAKFQRDELPPRTDWSDPDRLVRYMHGRNDGPVKTWTSERRQRRYDAQLELVEEESRRVPEPATRSERSLRLEGLGCPTRTCRSCGRPKAYVAVDKGKVWAKGMLTQRCRYCLCWRQTPISGSGA